MAQEPEEIEDAEPVFEAGAVGINLALNEARDEPSLHGDVAAFLAAQRSLIELQKHHLRSQFGQMRLRTVGDMIKLALQGLSLAALLAVAVGLGLMVRDAMGAHGLVVAGFSAPPSFAERGVSGQTLAEEMTSRIAAVARVANDNSLSRSDEVRADSAEAVKLEIPETGVSLGEVSRYLRGWLGHETLLTGDLRDEDSGTVSITLDIAGEAPIVVRGPSADLDGLMQTAAEKAFAVFDPVNVVQYLAVQGRYDEAFAAAEHTVRISTERKARADAYALWANLDGDRRRGLRKALVAIDADPSVMVGWMEATNSSNALGHDEAGLHYAQRLVQSRLQDQMRQQRAGYASVMSLGRGEIDQAVGDYPRLLTDVGFGLTPYIRGAQVAARLHDPRGAEAQLERAMTAETPTPSTVLETHWYVASGSGDWPAALAAAQGLADAEAALRTAPADFISGRADLRWRTRDLPWLAIAQAMNGQAAQAQATISTTPLDCYLCVRARGQIAAAAGDAAGADRWFAEAVRQGPSLPFAYLEWGQAKLARGDAASAITEFAKAHARAPRFADPLEGWGEALLAKGDAADAAAKFRDAALIAPRWSRLHLKWSQALARQGKSEDAARR